MPNTSKARSPVQWLKWWASGAVRSTNQNPDHDPLMAASARHELAGRSMLAWVLRTEADKDPRDRKRLHKPSLGPYSATNFMHCMNCGKVGEEWIKGEECVPAT